MKIYIAHNTIPIHNKKSLFVLTRPFLNEDNWYEDADEFEKYRTLPEIFKYELDVTKANLVLIPFSINFYFNSNQSHLLQEINTNCIANNSKAFGYISGDFGTAFPEFSNIIYLRQGGFKSKLSHSNKGFPVALSDHFQRLFRKETITPTAKKELPIVSFCGHATLSPGKRFKELVKCVLENAKRFFKNPLNKVYEPLFSSAYERAKLLAAFEAAPQVKTNFIYRENYRGGAVTEGQRMATTQEYYDNIKNSDYVLCVRGAGNFSVRLYETLMMGRIPIFVNTDCLLPFEDQIDWKQHVVWVEWKDRKNIADAVFRFHNNLSEQDFINLQFANRKLWKETLSVSNMLKLISDGI